MHRVSNNGCSWLGRILLQHVTRYGYDIHSLPWKDPPCLIDKPYISKGHRNPMANCQCHNQRVTFVTPKTWAWNKMIHDCPICSYWKLQFLGGSVVPWFHMKFACGAPIWARLPILHVGFERQPILIDFTGTSEWIPWVFFVAHDLFPSRINWLTIKNRDSFMNKYDLFLEFSWHIIYPLGIC